MRNVIKLTTSDGSKILIGVDSIINAYSITQNNSCSINPKIVGLTKIESRHAMVTSNIVKESVDEIYNLINN